MGYELEKQLDDLIEKANKEEDKERFKALKTLASYHGTRDIRTYINLYVDGTYDLYIEFIRCCKTL